MARGGRREGAGRKPGARNKVTLTAGATLTELAKAHTAEAFGTLVEVMRDAKSTSGARVTCACVIIERAEGKAPQKLEHTGKDGAPIEHEHKLSDLDLARAIAFALEKGARAKKE